MSFSWQIYKCYNGIFEMFSARFALESPLNICGLSSIDCFYWALGNNFLDKKDAVREPEENRFLSAKLRFFWMKFFSHFEIVLHNESYWKTLKNLKFSAKINVTSFSLKYLPFSFYSRLFSSGRGRFFVRRNS